MKHPTTFRQSLQDHCPAIVGIGACAFLYLNLFRLPCTPIFIGEDQNHFLLNALRMREGQVMYRDFFELVAPGITLLDASFFRLFGPRAWIPNFLLILVGWALTWMIVGISKRILTGFAVYLPAALFLIFGLGSMLDNTHHWYSELFVLSAVLCLIDRQDPFRLVSAGALCGLATFFTQTQGGFAVAAFAAYLIWQGRKNGLKSQKIFARVMIIVAGYGACVAALFAYFLWKAGPSTLWYDLVEFNIRYYPADRRWNSFAVLPLDALESIQRRDLPGLASYLFIHSLLPLVYFVFWWINRRRIAAHEWDDRPMLVTVVGLFIFAAIAPSPSTYRAWAVAPPGLILFIRLIDTRSGFARILSKLCWACVLCGAVALPLQTQVRPMQPLGLPRGRVELDATNYEKLLWLSRHTHPGEFVFAAASTEDLFPLALKNPAEVRFLTTNGFTRPEQVAQVVDALEAYRVPMVLSEPTLGFQSDESARASVPEPHRGYLRNLFHGIRMSMIGGDRTDEDNLAPLRYYIRSHYGLTTVLADETEVWERNPSDGFN